MDVETACRQAALSIGYPELKAEQLEAMKMFVSGRDVFVVLPTGFGKSLIFASLPLVFDTLNATSGSVIVVVTPLTAIMKDQVLIKLIHSQLYMQTHSCTARVISNYRAPVF